MTLSRLLFLFVFISLYLSGHSQETTSKRRLSYKIDDWAKVYEFTLGTDGNTHLFSYSVGVTMLEDWPVGGRMEYLTDNFESITISVAPYTKYYFREAPLRIVTDLSSGLTYTDSNGDRNCRSLYLHYQVGAGIAYPISRMGDPFNLELMAYYRSGYLARCAEPIFLPSIKFSIYM